MRQTLLRRSRSPSCVSTPHHAPFGLLVQRDQPRERQHTSLEHGAFHARDDVLHIDVLVRVVRAIPFVVDLLKKLG